MNCFIIYLFLIWLTVNTSLSLSIDNSLDITNEKENTIVNPIKTSVACNKTSLEVAFNFEKPFYGVIYSNQIFSKSASQCRSYGNGSQVIHFITNSHECGVRYSENETSEYELVLYIQNDRNIQQSSDEKMEVKCWPQEVQLRKVVALGGPQQSKLSAKSLYGGAEVDLQEMSVHNYSTLSYMSESLECRMDVMRGRIPFLKPIDGFIDLGQDVTLLIRIKEIDGIDSMVSRCYAHEGSHAVKQELTNTDGCSIDKSILPNFQLMPNPPSDFKVYFTTFPAFKFPDKTNLNIQCTLIICNKTCPQIECDNTRGIGIGYGMSGPVLHRIKRLALHGKQRKQRKQRNVLRAIIMGRELTANNNNEYNSRHSLSDITITTITNSHHLTDQHSIPGLSIPGLHSHKAITTITPIREVYMDTKPSDQLHRSDQSDRWAQCLTRQLVLTIAALITMTIAVMSALTITCYTSYCPLKRKLLLFSDKSTQSHTSAYDMQTNHYPTHQTSARSLPALSAPSSKP